MDPRRVSKVSTFVLSGRGKVTAEPVAVKRGWGSIALRPGPMAVPTRLELLVGAAQSPLDAWLRRLRRARRSSSRDRPRGGRPSRRSVSSPRAVPRPAAAASCCARPLTGQPFYRLTSATACHQRPTLGLQPRRRTSDDPATCAEPVHQRDRPRPAPLRGAHRLRWVAAVHEQTRGRDEPVSPAARA